jgi:hypothetical protein
MKKYKRKFLKIIKWGAIVIFGYWFLSTLILGHTDLNSKTGIQTFGWSGLDALFSNQEFGFFIDEPLKTNLRGVDGPYIFNETKFWVNEESKLYSKKIDRNKPIVVNVNNEAKDKFKINLKRSYQQEKDYYDLPTKLIAISDIEGNFNALHSFLINNKVIDENYNWIFGDGHLVLNGDFFDRGENVTQALWLIYSLEKKAEEKNGKVHFINGNHEIMNLYGDVSYSVYRYVEVAKQISKEKYWNEASKYLYSENSELGKWLRTKNVVEKIGGYIFVHGGLNKKIIDADLNITQINRIAKDYYGKRFQKDKSNQKEKLIVQSQNSPYWDRSLATDVMNKTVFFFNGASLEKTTESELETILEFYDSEKLVIGHSVVEKVSTDYNGKVIKIDVKHGKKKNSKKTQGLLIENGIEYIVNGLGDKGVL